MWYCHPTVKFQIGEYRSQDTSSKGAQKLDGSHHTLQRFFKIHETMASFEDKEIKRVLVIIAMEAEAQPLFDSMHLPKIAVNVPFAAFEVHQGEHNGIMLTVVTNGKDSRFGVCNVGTTPGTCCSRYLIKVLFLTCTSIHFLFICTSNSCPGCVLHHSRDPA